MYMVKRVLFLSALLGSTCGILCQRDQLTGREPTSCGQFEGLSVSKLEFK
jgi:hypothetical protein